jgi:hypothetical protein
MSYVSLMEFIKDTYKEWRKTFDMQVDFSPWFWEGELPLIFDRSLFDWNPLMTMVTAFFYLF